MCKIINVRGVNVSEDTVVEALKKHIDFKELVTDFKVYGFYAEENKEGGDYYNLALSNSYSEGFPANYSGRCNFSKGEIEAVIMGLKELIKD